MDGQHIRVDRAARPSLGTEGEKGSSGVQYDPKRSVFVGNIGFLIKARAGVLMWCRLPCPVVAGPAWSVLVYTVLVCAGLHPSLPLCRPVLLCAVLYCSVPLSSGLPCSVLLYHGGYPALSCAALRPCTGLVRCMRRCSVCCWIAG